MISPAVFWPSALGLTFLAAGIWTYRRDLLESPSREGGGFAAIGPVFVAASLAAFAGEHFTAAKSMVFLVPKYMPARLLIVYFVGVAHLAAALSYVARRYIRWSSICVAVMFGLFVLLIYMQNIFRHPEARMSWVFPFREGTFAMGALALFATDVRDRWAKASNRLARVAAIWTGIAIMFYGVEHLVYPQYSPGVPDSKLTAHWVPLPLALAYLTGILLIVFGAAMWVRKYAGAAGTSAGLLMLLLTLALYVPEFFLAHNASERVNAINFIFDTLLYSGTLLLVAKANLGSRSRPIAISQTAT